MAEVFLSLGSNLGDRLGYISSAIKEIQNLKEIRIIKFSSIYKTQPWGNEQQNEFLNTVLKIYTKLKPAELLRKLKTIEKILGRKNNGKWESREIDIDILFYDDLIINSEDLIVPHPEIPNRKFVLVPFTEVEPNFVHPILKKSILDLLKTTKDKLKCELYRGSEVLITEKRKKVEK